jgi:hypothetical protein
VPPPAEQTEAAVLAEVKRLMRHGHDRPQRHRRDEQMGRPVKE